MALLQYVHSADQGRSQYLFETETLRQLHLSEASPRYLVRRHDGRSRLGAPQTNPLDNVFDQIANSWRVRLNHDYVVSPSIINHLTFRWIATITAVLTRRTGRAGIDKLGITGIPADTGAFPQINFSGGAVSPAQLNRGYDENWRDVRYSVIENLTRDPR